MSIQKPTPRRFIFAIASIVAAQAIGAYKVMILEGDSTIDLLVIAAVFAVLGYFFYKGHQWARWILALILTFFAFAFFVAGSEDGDYEFLFASLAYAAALIPVIGRLRKSEVQVVQVRANRGQFVSHGTVYAYPSLVMRYKALFIDGMIWLTLMVITMVALGDSEHRPAILITMGLLGTFAYEPLLTAYSATIGQRAMSIRVRYFDDPTKKVGLMDAYLRALAKYFLGWVSFITINFNKEHRAIHDFAGRSVMVTLKSSTLPQDVKPGPIRS